MPVKMGGLLDPPPSATVAVAPNRECGELQVKVAASKIALKVIIWVDLTDTW